MSTPCAVWAGPSRKRLTGAEVSLAVSVCALATVACNVNNPGVVPPARDLNYPLVAAQSRTQAPGEPPRWLYVVNSNFNLRYNTGSLQSFDLEEIDRALQHSCVPATMDAKGGATAGFKRQCNQAGGSIEGKMHEQRCCLSCLEVPSQVLCDGRDDAVLEACCQDTVDNDEFRFIPDGGEVRIVSFGSGIVPSSDGSRLYISVRGDNSLAFVDVDDQGRLECGQDADRRCADDFRVVKEAPLSDSDAQLAPLPLDVIAGAPADFGVTGDAELVLTAHFDGSVSMFVDKGDGPKLRATLPKALDAATSTMRLDPVSHQVFVTHDTTQRISRVGIERTGGRYLPYRSAPVTLQGLTDNQVSRDVAFHPTNPERFYALVQGGGVDSRALYFLERDPDSLLEAETVDVERVGLGPARVEFAEMAGSGYLFVSCYEDRSIFIIEADTRQLVAFVRGLIGPFELEIDPVRERAYVMDFANSTVRVVDLRGLTDPARESARIVMTLGKPKISGGGV